MFARDRAVNGSLDAPASWWPRLLLATGFLLLSAAALQLLRGYEGNAGAATAALAGGAMAAMATAIGALPVMLRQRYADRTCDAMLGFGAGVMLAACCFSLIIPALRSAAGIGFDRWGSCGVVGSGILLGAVAVMVLDRILPHEHFIKGAEGPEAVALKRTWLFVIAIALHNVPEGLAIGVAFAGTDVAAATALAAGIAIQDVPEGLVVALALRAAGYRRATAVALAAASGVVEPLAALFGAAVVSVSQSLLPWGLSLAAGAMLFVISHEIIPESHRKGHERFATAGLLVGFVAMMTLDTALG